MPLEFEETESVRFRPLQCNECAGDSTLLDFLIRSHAASGPVSGGSPDEIVEEITARERPLLLEWVESCPHTQWLSTELHKLDEGSEHVVYFGEDKADVVKLTRVGTYGDWYFVNEGRVFQRNATPGDYLMRQFMLLHTFGFAAVPMGITAEGQIVSVQKFVYGSPPSQIEVDEFLLAFGFDPVKRSCWLWKKGVPGDNMDFWIGDARADNFVKTSGGIVPIDLRMWVLERDQVISI